ncbi:MAG: UDP-glucose 4-epimerase GalE [Pseudomonadota bacterium]
MTAPRAVLVTGGAGYIGSHACVALINVGYQVIVLDNLCNSSDMVLSRLERISGSAPLFVQGDVRDGALLNQIFANHKIVAVMHFAGLKAVGESVAIPLEYYSNNVVGTLSLLGAMERAQVQKLIFSSSATVYGQPEQIPVGEDAPRSATNPYGRSKLIVENILEDVSRAQPKMRIALLRYFNPVGAHPSGLIGEDPQGTPNNLMPFISQVAVGRRDKLLVYGGDYLTPDGTAIRDYIHVMDLAEGHVAALRYLEARSGMLAVNLGTGQGSSVLQVIKAFESATSCVIPFEVVGRRAGDIAACWADPNLASETLGWKASRGLVEMCEDSWRWQKSNPRGYE